MSRPKAGSDFRIEEFGRRRRPNSDAREARLAQKAQKWGFARRRREFFGDMGYILMILGLLISYSMGGVKTSEIFGSPYDL